MSEYKIGLNSLKLNYLPDYNSGGLYSFDTGTNLFSSASASSYGFPNFFNSANALFPMDITSFSMPQLGSVGGFDPFGFSTPGFNYMQEFFEAQQQQNMISQMWGSFMELVKNYKMPQFDFNFNFNQAGSGGGGYGNYNQKATDLYQGTAADLNKHLKGVLAGKGAKLLELQNKYGISAAFLAAVVNNESGHGTSNAARTKNNVAGIMSKSSGFTKLATFNSVDECLEALAKNIKKNYVDKGLVTVSQIHAKYCPIGASNDPTGMNGGWGKNVASMMDKYNSLA